MPDAGEKLELDREAYIQTFLKNGFGARVLLDLEDVCYGRRGTYSSNERETAFNEGKRWVWLRIQKILALTNDQMENLVAQAQLSRPEGE